MGILEETLPFIFLHSVLFHMQTLPLAHNVIPSNIYFENVLLLMNKSENVSF